MKPVTKAPFPSRNARLSSGPSRPSQRRLTGIPVPFGGTNEEPFTEICSPAPPELENSSVALSAQAEAAAAATTTPAASAPRSVVVLLASVKVDCYRTIQRSRRMKSSFALADAASARPAHNRRPRRAGGGIY